MTASAEWTFDRYRRGDTPLPRPNLAWNTYGKGVESIGRDGRPEPVEIPGPASDQMLVRVDAAAAALSEPWACVEAAYTQRRRLRPLDGGTAWIIGHPEDGRLYDFGDSLRGAARILLTGLSPEVRHRAVEASGPLAAVSIATERSRPTTAPSPTRRPMAGASTTSCCSILPPATK